MLFRIVGNIAASVPFTLAVRAYLANWLNPAAKLDCRWDFALGVVLPLVMVAALLSGVSYE